MFHNTHCIRRCFCRPPVPQPAPSFRSLCFYKLARDSGAGLPGALFELRPPNGAALTAVSNADGLVCFTVSTCVDYVLAEVTPPSGYVSTGEQVAILVDQCGRLFVNGQCTAQFAVYNDPATFGYTVNYYADSIAPSNLLGIATGSGTVGEPINADLTLFAPSGHIVPGVRSGAETITAVPGDNVVNVVYRRMTLNWVIEYYVDTVSPANLLGRTSMPAVAYGTFITLTPAQLDAFRPPSGYLSGQQVGGPVAITTQGQVVQVLYEAIPLNPVVITGDAINILPNSATISNNTYSEITGTISSVGVQYSTSPSMTSPQTATGVVGSPYSVNLTGLQPNTTYYYRASVSASSGQFFGEIKSFTTPQLV